MMEPFVEDIDDLPVEVWKVILSFCDANTLCALDLVASAFVEDGLVDSIFAHLALKRFGMSSEPNQGKTTWSKGIALTQPRRHFLIPLAQPGEYVCEPNRPDLRVDSMAAHPTSSFVLYNMDNFAGGTFELLSGNNPICYRDAQTLNFVRVQTNPWIVWSLAICGLPGCEVVVASHQSEIMANQGGRSQEIFLSNYDREGARFQERQGHSMDMIGNERYLIIIGGDVIYIFQPTLQIGGDLLSFVTSVAFNGGQIDEARPALAWASPELPGTFGLVPRGKAVSVWRVDEVEDGMDTDATNALGLTEMKTFSTVVSFGCLAVGERYVAGAAEPQDLPGGRTVRDNSRIRVHKRDSGEQLHILQEPDIERSANDSLFYATRLEFVGDLLVSTSHLGNVLCIWHAKHGTLLKRYEDAILRGVNRGPSDTPLDVTSMVRLHGTGSVSFLTAAGPNVCLWSFPYDWRGEALTENLANRELLLEECENTFNFHQDMRGLGA